MQVCAKVYRSHHLVLYVVNYCTWRNLLVGSGARILFMMGYNNNNNNNNNI
jgi:hypothetical protein